MTDPNRNALWARAAIDELASAGVDAVCLAPGSRSTPLTVAVAEHDEIRAYSHLDERSAAYFALGRGKRTGRPTPIVCTSGTAAANFHPAVIEASKARVPLLVLTADRPPSLRDSGANQTVDQEKLYGDAVRWYRDLPEPEADPRKVRSLRTTIGRAVTTSTGTPAGPVHLNFPFRKPLEPTDVPGDVPENFADTAPLAAEGRDGPFVQTYHGTSAIHETDLSAVASALEGAERVLVVAGPSATAQNATDELAALAATLDAPVLADPLSGLRFGPHVEDALVCGGYDSYLDEHVTADWPDPDAVLRVGASPTSKTLRNYLRRVDARQFLVDPAGEWREATFTASDFVVADPGPLARDLAGAVEDRSGSSWRRRFATIESRYAELIDEERDAVFEGRVLADAVEFAPDPATLFVSNSMPVRDLDRFGGPRAAEITALGNRGASGIDGITSTALGTGSATDDPLVLVIGDLAYYHDMNGLLAIGRCGVDATIVLINNDGGGIFHMLPIAEFDPPFTEQFKTPHGLDFEPTGDLYDLSFERVAPGDSFRDAYRASLSADGTQVIEVTVDAAESHRTREAIQRRICDRLS